MTTEAPEAQAGEIQLLALSQLHPHPANRKRFDPKKLKELVDSIRKVGILAPLIVRASPGEPTPGAVAPSYELIAGQRRWCAAALAGVHRVFCIVRELTDDAALELLLTENLQREDLHPLEEATTYQAWLDRPGHDVKELAARIGKSVTHVYSRLQLRQLTEESRAAVWAGQLPIGHALVLARLRPDQQKLAVDRVVNESWRGTPTLASFTTQAVRAGEVLADAPFDTKDATLCPAAGSCLACPKRLHYTEGMFPELAAEIRKAVNDEGGTHDELAEDRCLDPGCYQEKVGAHVAQSVAAARAKYGDRLVLLSARYGESWPAKASAPLPQGLWNKAAQKAAGAVPGILVKADDMVSGLAAGALLWVQVKPRPKAGTHASTTVRTDRAPYHGAAETTKREARCAIEQPRRIALAQAILAKVPRTIDLPFLLEFILEERCVSRPAMVAAGKVLQVKAPSPLSPQSTPADVMHGLVLASCSEDLEMYSCGYEPSSPRDLLRLAHHFGVNAKKILAEHDAQVKAAAAKAATKSAGTGEKTTPVKGTCQVCGCTEKTPCDFTGDDETCSWANKELTLCTNCPAPKTTKPRAGDVAAAKKKAKKGGR